MISKYIVLWCTFIFVQEAWFAPQAPASYGAQMSDQFNKNLKLIMGNLHNGATKLVKPQLKFAFDTVPSIISSGAKKTAKKVSVIADAKKEAFGKIATGAAHALGAGGVLASSVAGGAMQAVGGGLGAVNGVVETGAKTGLKIAGKLADKTAGGVRLGGDVANTALTAVSDGLTAAEAVNNVFSNRVADLMNKIEGRVQLSLSSAGSLADKLIDSGSQKVEEGVTSASTSMQTSFYKSLMSLLQIMDNVQNMLESTSKIIAGSAAESSDSAASTGSDSGDTTGTSPSNDGTAMSNTDPSTTTTT